MANISVLGSGSWGSALATMWARNGHTVRIWSRDMDIDKSTHGAEIIVNAIPSHAVREVMEKLRPFYQENQIIINVCKGIEVDTLMRMSEVVKDVIPNAKIAIMSGPSLAMEVNQDVPTTNIIATSGDDTTESLRNTLANPRFRIYAVSDIIGIEIAGSLKTIIALCAGIVDGLGYGNNTKAALITRGIAEMTRLGVKLGAKSKTFAGLAGIGDVIVTANSKHSRNYSAGLLIGQGKSVEEAEKEVKMVVEGIRTTAAAFELANKNNVDTPIINEAYQIIYKGKDPKKAVGDLMNRELKWE